MDFKYCPYCGHEYREEGEEYCGGCGRPVNESPTIRGLLFERIRKFFSMDYWEDNFFMSIIVPVLVVLVFAVVFAHIMSDYQVSHDKNQFVYNETIIGKYMNEDGRKFIVTENGQYSVSSRIYYSYDVNDTFDGSWYDLEIRNYGTMLKGEY